MKHKRAVGKHFPLGTFPPPALPLPCHLLASCRWWPMWRVLTARGVLIQQQIGPSTSTQGFPSSQRVNTTPNQCPKHSPNLTDYIHQLQPAALPGQLLHKQLPSCLQDEAISQDLLPREAKHPEHSSLVSCPASCCLSAWLSAIQSHRHQPLPGIAHPSSPRPPTALAAFHHPHARSVSSPSHHVPTAQGSVTMPAWKLGSALRARNVLEGFRCVDVAVRGLV